MPEAVAGEANRGCRCLGQNGTGLAVQWRDHLGSYGRVTAGLKHRTKAASLGGDISVHQL